MTHEYWPSCYLDNPRRPDRCKSAVHDKYGVGFHQCSRKRWKDGWCKQHHPDSVEKRRIASEQRWEAKIARSPTARLDKARDEIERLKARIAELEGR